MILTTNKNKRPIDKLEEEEEVDLSVTKPTKRRKLSTDSQGDYILELVGLMNTYYNSGKSSMLATKNMYSGMLTNRLGIIRKTQSIPLNTQDLFKIVEFGTNTIVLIYHSRAVFYDIEKKEVGLVIDKDDRKIRNAVSLPNNRLAITLTDGDIHIYTRDDTKKYMAIRNMNVSSNVISFDDPDDVSNNNKIAFGTTSGNIYGYDLKTGKCFMNRMVVNKHIEFKSSVKQISHISGEKIFTIVLYEDGRIHLFDRNFGILMTEYTKDPIRIAHVPIHKTFIICGLKKHLGDDEEDEDEDEEDEDEDEDENGDENDDKNTKEYRSYHYKSLSTEFDHPIIYCNTLGVVGGAADAETYLIYDPIKKKDIYEFHTEMYDEDKVRKALQNQNGTRHPVFQPLLLSSGVLLDCSPDNKLNFWEFCNNNF